MKTKLFIIVIILVVVSVSVQAQYSASINYGNVDWIPKSNKVLAYENVFVMQSFSINNISVWQASCITKSPNSYELGGLDYSKSLGNVKTRFGFHGFFPKSSMFQYNGSGNLIPNIGISMYGVTVNTYQFWNYGLSNNYIVSNALYKKTFAFGNVEAGQYYNFKNNALSGSVAYSKSWPIYKKLSGFASIRWSFNESKTKLNDGNSIIVNVGIKI